MPSSKLLL
jgi:pimeloyl-ACP methyl ester carboxylesterase